MVTADGTARIIADIPMLERRLEQSGPDCLSRDVRKTYLAESDVEARARLWWCERSP